MNNYDTNPNIDVTKGKIETRVTQQSIEKALSNTSLGTIWMRLSGTAYCPVCEKPVELLTFEAAAETFRTDLQDIEYLAKRGEVHRIHNRAATVMICSVSLFDCFDERQTRLLDSYFIDR